MDYINVPRLLVPVTTKPSYLVPYAPLEICAVGGFVRRGARSYVWRVTTIHVLSSIGSIVVKMFVARAGWCPQLTNET